MMACCEQFIAGSLPVPVEGGEVYDYANIDENEDLDVDSSERKRDIEDKYGTMTTVVMT